MAEAYAASSTRITASGLAEDPQPGNTCANVGKSAIHKNAIIRIGCRDRQRLLLCEIRPDRDDGSLTFLRWPTGNNSHRTTARTRTRAVRFCRWETCSRSQTVPTVPSEARHHEHRIVLYVATVSSSVHYSCDGLHVFAGQHAKHVDKVRSDVDRAAATGLGWIEHPRGSACDIAGGRSDNEAEAGVVKAGR